MGQKKNKNSLFLTLVISCPLLKETFFKECALTAVDRSVQRLPQCIILSCWLQKLDPPSLFSSAGMCSFQTLHAASPSYHWELYIKDLNKQKMSTCIVKNHPRLLLQTTWSQPGYKRLPKVHRLPVIHPKKPGTLWEPWSITVWLTQLICNVASLKQNEP